MSELAELATLFNDVNNCCLHNPQWNPEDVEDIIKWVGDHETGRESQSFVIVSLKNGFFGLFVQSEDYTGHGCQCGAMAVSEPFLGKLLTHLTNYEIELMLAK